MVPTHDYTSKQKMMMMKIPYAVSRTLDSLMEPQYPRKLRMKIKAPSAMRM